ncbi:MAG TPA: adenylate/guanylate cyclase domain-containing protein [Thermodesulfovibrionia bacterium]|nr:adenylate/guanylate cyclase domain-containing protein [Thermodesulfovibrionia bacterium]
MDDNPKEKSANLEPSDIDKLLEQREQLDKLFKEKFTRLITVMFTDLKGSTAIAEMQGDLASRSLIKQHNDIVFPIVAKNQGVLVKTMGDGTMSYFNKPQDSIRAAIEIQKGIDQFNLEKKTKVPILIRIGIHTGQGIVEEKDIFGDVVNVASRFEGQANPGEICISEETYNALDDKSEFYCRFVKEAALKGKKEPVKLYKAFWNPKEIEAELHTPVSVKVEVEAKKELSLTAKVVLFIIMPLLIIFSVIYLRGVFSISTEKRTKHHSVTIPAPIEEQTMKNTDDKDTFKK